MKFSDSDLAKQFVPYFESGQRIEVKFIWGDKIELKRGTVGVTTGWKPVFLLMKNSRSIGSSDILTKNVEFFSGNKQAHYLTYDHPHDG